MIAARQTVSAILAYSLNGLPMKAKDILTTRESADIVIDGSNLLDSGRQKAQSRAAGLQSCEESNDTLAMIKSSTQILWFTAADYNMMAAGLRAWLQTNKPPMNVKTCRAPAGNHSATILNMSCVYVHQRHSTVSHCMFACECQQSAQDAEWV